MRSSLYSLHYQNAAGSLYRHAEGFAALDFATGTRRLSDFTALLTQTGLLLWEQNWNGLLSYQYYMAPVTPQEQAWMQDYWGQGKIKRPAKVNVCVIGVYAPDATLHWPQ